jgi:hypothetical protein
MGHLLDCEEEVAEGQVVVYHTTHGRLTVCLVVDRLRLNMVADIDAHEEHWCQGTLGLLVVGYTHTKYR